MPNFDLSMRRYHTDPVLRDILQNNWLAFFKRAIVIKGKERLRKYPRLEEACRTAKCRQTMQLSGLKKAISGTIGKI